MTDDDVLLPAVSEASLVDLAPGTPPGTAPAPATPPATSVTTKSPQKQQESMEELVDVGSDSSSLYSEQAQNSSSQRQDNASEPKGFPPPVLEPHPPTSRSVRPPESSDVMKNNFLKALLQTAMICKLVMDSPKDSYYQDTMLDKLQAYISKPTRTSGPSRRQQARELLNHVYWLYQNYQATPGNVKALTEALNSSLTSYIGNIRSENGWLFKFGDNSRLAYALEMVMAQLNSRTGDNLGQDLPDKVKENLDFMAVCDNFKYIAKTSSKIEDALQEMILSELIDLNTKAIQKTGVKKGTYSPISEHLVGLLNIRDENFNPITDVDEKLGMRLVNTGMVDRFSNDCKTKSLIDYLRNFFNTKKQSIFKGDKKSTEYFSAFEQWFEQVEITNPRQEVEETRESSCASRLFGSRGGE